MGGLQGVVHVLYGVAHGGLQRNLVKLLNEEVAVFGVHDGFDAGSQYLDTILLQDSLLVKLSTAVQSGLTTKSQENAVGAFLLDNLCNKMSGNGLEIHLVGNTFRSLNGSDVGIYQN